MRLFQPRMQFRLFREDTAGGRRWVLKGRELDSRKWTVVGEFTSAVHAYTALGLIRLVERTIR